MGGCEGSGRDEEEGMGAEDVRAILGAGWRMASSAALRLGAGSSPVIEARRSPIFVIASVSIR